MPNIPHDLANLPTTDEGRAEMCLLELLEILYSPLSPRYRIQAANLILRYCAPFPVRGLSLSPDETVGWLESLTSDEPRGS